MKDSSSKKTEKLNYREIIIIAALLVVAAFAIWKSSEVAKDYESKGIDAEYYADGKDFISLLSETIERCNESKEGGWDYRCEKSIDAIEKTAALHDLDAQETVAKATRGLLWIGMYQFAATALTVAFLAWAVIQTHGMLVEARATSKFAEEALQATRASTEIQLQPYFTIEFSSLWSIKDTFRIGININNIGKAPATDILMEFKARKSVIVRYVSPKRGNQNPFRVSEIRTSQAPEAISSDAPGQFWFEAFTTPVAPNETHDRFTIILEGMVLRYKDFTCADTDFHKRADIAFQITREVDSTAESGFKVGGVTRVTSYRNNQKDSDHSEYSKLIEPEPIG